MQHSMILENLLENRIILENFSIRRNCPIMKFNVLTNRKLFDIYFGRPLFEDEILLRSVNMTIRL